MSFPTEDHAFDNDYYRFLTENTADMISHHSPDGTYRYVSPVSLSLLGYATEELVGRVSYDLFHPEDLKSIRRSNETPPVPGDTSIHWYRIKRKDNTYIWVETTSRYISEGGSDQIEEIISVSRDVTDRKRWESARQDALNALAKAREIESEIGFRIQQSLLVPEPFLKSDWVTVSTLALSSSKVDGDYFDFFHCNENCFDLVIGDVMGKGVPAALLGAATKSHFQRASHRLLLKLAPFKRIPEPQEVVNVVHEQMTQELIRLSSFVTLCYTRFDRQENKLTLVDCGHTGTIHYRCLEKDCEILKGENLPLGVDNNEIIRPIIKSFAPGDILVFYSDGVTEAENREGEPFGNQRLIALVEAGAEKTPADITDSIRNAVLEFTGTEEVSDDLTCVVVRIEDTPVQIPLTKRAIEVRSSLDELQLLRDWVHDLLEAVPHLTPDEVEMSKIILAVNEAVCNVHNHAYKGFSEARLQITGECYTNRFVINLYDFGLAFNPDFVEEPSFDGSRDHGFGIFIIRATMDEVVYTRDDLGRNCLTLVKYRQNSLK